MGTSSTAVIDLTQELKALNHVSFDPNNAVLEGAYSDELSAHRVKRGWIQTLEHYFLLDNGHDFAITLSGNIENAEYQVECKFLTACGRYTFWRLTNNQAPEAQYAVETAHIPNAESLYLKILQAPDLSLKKSAQLLETDKDFTHAATPLAWLTQLIKK